MEFPSPSDHVLPDQIPLVLPRISLSESEKFVGSMLGLAAGDALGASVEFRPHEYFIDNPVKDMKGGGTWGLKSGQWTDDTSMALCLASSLITNRGYNPYDQMVRYKWWYKYGYLSSTGYCFDIGNATRDSLEEFSRRQKSLIKYFHCKEDEVDYLSWDEIQSVKSFDVNCSSSGVAGNGALMRLAPVPLFFYKYPNKAVEYAGDSARLTHGDRKAVDACRYYAALIVAAVNNKSKEQILSDNFYETYKDWFGSTELHPEVLTIAHGSYKKPNGYKDGIRGKGYIVKALEAALWAFWSDGDSFEKGALNAVNLGDDTDTTAAIYGQLAGAYYGYRKLPEHWLKQIYARKLLECIGQWIYYEGKRFDPMTKPPKIISSGQTSMETSSNKQQSNISRTFTHDTTVTSPRIHLTETQYTPRSQSNNEKLPLDKQDYHKSIAYQRDNEQSSIRQSNSDHYPKYQQDIDQSRRHRQNFEEKPNYVPKNDQVTKYHQYSDVSDRQSSNFRQSRASIRDDYSQSGYRSNINPSLSHTSGYQDSSKYGTNIYHPVVYHSDANQSRIPQNDTQTNTYRPTQNLSRIYENEQTFPRRNRNSHDYTSNEMDVYSPRNNRYSINEADADRIIDRHAHNVPTNNSLRNSTNRGITYYDEKLQDKSYSPQTTFVDPRPKYYTIAGKIYWY